jgi:Fic family protein
MDIYKPPYAVTSKMLHLVAEIAESIGRYSAIAESSMTPRLRRTNRIRSIHASLAIENNTLSLEQVTAVIDGKRVLGLPQEIQEVRNAFGAYEQMEKWNPTSSSDLLEAHGLLAAGLVDDPGVYRSGGVGIFKGEKVAHMGSSGKAGLWVDAGFNDLAEINQRTSINFKQCLSL